MGSNIRILHVTERHSQEAGGVTTVVNDLAGYMTNLGAYCCILAATDKDEVAPQDVGFIGLGERCNQVSALFSVALADEVSSLIRAKEINRIHIHGFWMPLQLIAARVASEMNIPFIITSHGMLEPWLWTGKGKLNNLKKKLFFKFFAYPVFRRAARIHAITPNENSNLKRLFPENNTVIVPNAIDGNIVEFGESVINDKTIFFIGRINPIKGVDLLLSAYKESGLFTLGWSLVIAGPEEVPEYADELRSFVKANGLDSKVQFIGAVYEKEKERWYRSSWVTVVPSFSEVIGMVNLEASLYSCPTITTHQCGLWDWEEGGGLLINPDVKALTASLKSCSKWSEKERIDRGQASYGLVQEKYSWGVVSKQWIALYEQLGEEV
jgi:glycosyltransferase involved in cell wall biosynthesis